MASVTLLPSAAVDRICHSEQMVIWAGDLAGSLNLGGYLRDDMSYDDGVDLMKCLEREIRSIIGMALDHPEARTVYSLRDRPVPKEPGR